MRFRRTLRSQPSVRIAVGSVALFCALCFVFTRDGSSPTSRPSPPPTSLQSTAAATPKSHGHESSSRFELGGGIVACPVTFLHPRLLFIRKADALFAERVCSGTGWDRDMEDYFAAFARKPGAKIVELGANYGYFTSLFSALLKESGGTIIAVEGDPEVHGLNSRAIAALGDWKNLKNIRNVIIAEDVGTGTARHNTTRFCITPGSLWSFMLREDQPTTECERVVTLPAFTAASFFEGPLSSYTLVKIDVDYAEHLAWYSLKALMARRGELLPHVSIELSGLRGYNLTDIISDMTSFYTARGGEVKALTSNECHSFDPASLRKDTDTTLCLCFPTCRMN